MHCSGGNWSPSRPGPDSNSTSTQMEIITYFINLKTHTLTFLKPGCILQTMVYHGLIYSFLSNR